MKHETKNPFDIFDEIFKDFNVIFTDNFFENKNYCQANFPPANVKISENKDLTFEFALVGYKKEDINLTFEGDKMILFLNPEKEKESKDVYLSRGIKKSQSKSKYVVPVSKYDVHNVSAKFSDGMLVIKVPAKEEAKPNKVNID